MNQQIKFNVTDDRSGDTRKVTLAEFDHWKRAGYRVLDPVSYDTAVAAANPQPEQPAPANEMAAQLNADAAAAAFAAIEAAGGAVDEDDPDVVAAREAMADSDFEGRQESAAAGEGAAMAPWEAEEVRLRLKALRDAGVVDLPSVESVLASIRG